MSDSDNDDEKIDLCYYGAKMTVKAPDDYKELFEAFLKMFSLNKNKKYELYYYDDKKKKTIIKNDEDSVQTNFIDYKTIYIEEIAQEIEEVEEILNEEKPKKQKIQKINNKKDNIESIKKKLEEINKKIKEDLKKMISLIDERKELRTKLNEKEQVIIDNNDDLEKSQIIIKTGLEKDYDKYKKTLKKKKKMFYLN